MPSVKNPNGPSQNRLKARASKARKQTSKAASGRNKSRALKADEKRGAREGLLPTSGPRRALGKKQQQKLERRIANELKRREAEEGATAAGEEEEEEMKDVAEDDEKDDARAIEEQMAMESENIA
ncbi:uncharacterized protein B0I36DRAFT_347911 [Microdochium trichocladiopsis]|uniref:Uncharacterized protein n=1 Tax=Microdochium trichocladiopsis TaxID=1682393 RepID=A0A9P8Y7R6_9PEZI|nr:uncharacterized protein B0I36DRAFT_347911 [Microdochium trichocladiopsis]KAH7032734.1 hypothetical protein B0I36DRAFT_347911 [Microdochium trichocladiopsis]